MSSFMLSVIVKVTVIVVLGLALALTFRRRSPAFRHVILFGTLVSVLLLPVLIAVAPAWNVAVLSPTASVIPLSNTGDGNTASEPATVPAVASSAGRQAEVSQPALSLSQRWTSIGTDGPTLALVIWLVGFAGVLTWLTVGHLRLRSLAKQSWPLDGADWSQILREENARANTGANISLLCHPDVSTPLTWGSIHPVIMLPEEALEWSEEHRRIVLRHELSHVERNDALAQLMAGFACAIYWFHPLVWIAEWKMRAESERACDDRVVASGTPGALYAAHLLEVARSARSFGAPGFLSVAMARPSQLEGRLLAVLNEAPRERAIGPRTRWLMIASMTLVALTVSAFRPVHRSASANEGVSLAPSETASPIAAVAADSSFERDVSVRSGGTLLLEIGHAGGNVSITGWDRPQVRVRGKLGGRNWRETRVTLEPANGGAILRDTYTGTSKNSSFSHSYEINVPLNFSVLVKSAGGGVSIRGVNGKFTGSTGGGPIVFDRATGEADLSTGGGDITVTSSALRGEVNTGGGSVRIDGTSRGLLGSSGTGDVSYTGSSSTDETRTSKTITDAGESRSTTTYMEGKHDSLAGFALRGIQRHSSGGDITIGDAPTGAHVTTGGGAIRIGDASGEIYATTGGGTIEIGPVGGSVVASTGAGDITVTFRGANRNAADLATGLGVVTLILPANSNAELVLETAYTNNFARKTRIESDWPLRTTETDRWDSSDGTPRKYVRARQILGTGGGVIRVRTVNGNVIVRKAGAD